MIPSLSFVIASLLTPSGALWSVGEAISDQTVR